MAKLQTLQENWVSNSNTQGGVWGGYFGSTTITGNQCNYTIATGAGNYNGFSSTASYDLTGSYLFEQLVSAGNQSLASLEVYLAQIDKDSNNKFSWKLNQNVFVCRYAIAGVNTDNASMAYVAGTHNWFRIRELNGAIYWDWSTDGISWTNRFSVATPWAISAVTHELSSGTFSTEASGTTAITGNINIVDTNKPGNRLPSMVVGDGMSRSEGMT